MTASLKLPTGSRRLSTRRADAGLAIELSCQFGSVTPHVSASYRLLGDRATLPLKDGWTSGAGVTLTRGRTMMLLSYERSDPIYTGPASRELVGLVSRSLAPNSLSANGSRGRSQGSADLMIGLSLSRSIAR